MTKVYAHGQSREKAKLSSDPVPDAKDTIKKGKVKTRKFLTGFDRVLASGKQE